MEIQWPVIVRYNEALGPHWAFLANTRTRLLPLLAWVLSPHCGPHIVPKLSLTVSNLFLNAECPRLCSGILSSSLCIHSLSSSLPTSMPLNPSYRPAGPSLTQDLLLTLSVSPACSIISLSTWVPLIIFIQSEWCFIPRLRFSFPTFFLVTPQFSQVARKQNV